MEYVLRNPHELARFRLHIRAPQIFSTALDCIPYAQYKKADVSASASLIGYGDASGVSVWATDAMQWAVGSGIINGIGSELAPVNHATRAQVATILMRYSTNK